MRRMNNLSYMCLFWFGSLRTALMGVHYRGGRGIFLYLVRLITQGFESQYTHY